MAKHILKCPKCKLYTMKDTCPVCNERCVSTRPPKYSPEDRLAGYRRKAKFEIEESEKKEE